MSKKSIIFFQAYHHNIRDAITYISKKEPVYVLTGKKQKHIPEGIPYRYIDSKVAQVKKFAFSTFSFLQLKNELKKAKYVVIKNRHEPKSILATIICRLYNIPHVLLVMREPKLTFFPNMLSKFVLSLIYPKKTPILAVIKQQYELLKKKYSSICYVPMPIEISSFPQKKYLSKKILNILYVCKFDKRKRLPLLFKAIQKIKTKGFDVKLRVVVAYSDYYKVEKEKTLDLVKEMQLQDTVCFEYNIPIEKMPSHFLWADIYVFPAISEPLGYSLVEAMAAGLPVISSDDIGAADYIVPNKTGYIFKKDSEVELIKYILKFFKNNKTDSQKIQLFGEHARSLIVKNNHPKDFYNALKSLSKA